MDPPGQLHHRQRRDRHQVRRGAVCQGWSVRVRVLHDWFGCMNVPRSFWRGMREAGVEVKLSTRPLRGSRWGYSARPPQAARHRRRVRLHGRVCIADGWMVRSPETGLPYRDTAVSVRGPVVGRHQPCLHQPVGRIGGRAARRSALSQGTSRRRETSARLVIQEPRRMRTLRMLELLTAGAGAPLDNRPLLPLLPILTQSLMATAATAWT